MKPFLSCDEAHRKFFAWKQVYRRLPLQEDENFTTNGLLVTFETATYAL